MQTIGECDILLGIFGQLIKILFCQYSKLDKQIAIRLNYQF